MVNKKAEPQVTFHGEINFDRLAWILGKVKSKHLGYPVTAKIITLNTRRVKGQQTKEKIKT